MIPLLIALAGGLGAASRLVVDGLVRHRVASTFPWATIFINVTGSFLLGLLVGADVGDRWLDVLGTGFLGGYTTFSTWMVERTYIVTSIVAGLAVATLGYALGSLL
jgi:CrcB protein